jgi:hypothetical protein
MKRVHELYNAAIAADDAYSAALKAAKLDRWSSKPAPQAVREALQAKIDAFEAWSDACADDLDDFREARALAILRQAEAE